MKFLLSCIISFGVLANDYPDITGRYWEYDSDGEVSLEEIVPLDKLKEETSKEITDFKAIDHLNHDYDFIGKLKLYLTENGKLKSSGCSGTLVSPDTVITARHCFFDTNNKVDRFRAKFYQKNDPSKGVNVSYMLFEKTKNHYGDIVVLKLESPLPLTSKINIKAKWMLTDIHNQNVIALGYPKIAGGDLVEDICHTDPWPYKKKKKNLISSSCFARKGSSGGAVIVKTGHKSYDYIGTISSINTKKYSEMFFAPVLFQIDATKLETYSFL